MGHKHRVSDADRPEPLPPGLYIVATPIGNLGDITQRAADVLARCDAVACEDTRVTARLLRHLGISKPLWRYDDHADERDRALYAKLRDYMIRVDDSVTCKTCGKKFDIPSQHSMVFIEKGGSASGPAMAQGGGDEDSRFNR